jgi:hypothetical protein
VSRLGVGRLRDARLLREAPANALRVEERLRLPALERVGNCQEALQVAAAGSAFLVKTREGRARSAFRGMLVLIFFLRGPEELSYLGTEYTKPDNFPWIVVFAWLRLRQQLLASSLEGRSVRFYSTRESPFNHSLDVAP